MYAERALMLLAIARATAGFVVLRAPPLRSLHGGHISRGYLDRHRSGSCLYTMMAGAKAGDKVTVSRVVGRDRKGGVGWREGKRDTCRNVNGSIACLECSEGKYSTCSRSL